jgi:protein-disulfide isomerase
VIKRTLFLSLAVASFATAACNAEKGSDSSANPSTPVKPVPAPNGGDWRTIVSQTAEGGFVMGNPNAAAKIVEFGSMTCPHCAEFDETGVKPLIDTYVKSGRVSYEFRNYVRDPYDMAASLVARCGGTASFFGLTRGLYADQKEWVTKIQGANPQTMQRISALPPQQQLPEIAKLAGFQDWAAQRGLPAAKSTACLSNQAEIDRLVQMNSEALEVYPDFPGTPSFLLNGAPIKIEPGSPVWTQVESKIKDALGG